MISPLKLRVAQPKAVAAPTVQSTASAAPAKQTDGDAFQRGGANATRQAAVLIGIGPDAKTGKASELIAAQKGGQAALTPGPSDQSPAAGETAPDAGSETPDPLTPGGFSLPAGSQTPDLTARDRSRVSAAESTTTTSSASDKQTQNKDGTSSQEVSTETTTKSSDGSSATDKQTSSSDGKGNTRETQDVSSTAADGSTQRERTERETRNGVTVEARFSSSSAPSSSRNGAKSNPNPLQEERGPPPSQAEMQATIAMQKARFTNPAGSSGARTHAQADQLSQGVGLMRALKSNPSPIAEPRLSGPTPPPPDSGLQDPPGPGGSRRAYVKPQRPSGTPPGVDGGRVD